MARRVTETVEEVFVDEPGTRRVTETVEEVFIDLPGTKRVTETVFEAFIDVGGARRVSEVVLEVFVNDFVVPTEAAGQGHASPSGMAAARAAHRAAGQGHASVWGTAEATSGPAPASGDPDGNRIGGTGAIRRGAHRRRRMRR